MGWKYVMMEATYGKSAVLFPVIFPDKMVHLEMATVLKLMSPLDGHKPRVVSAGEVTGLIVNATVGRSVTLQVDSREEDAGIIESYPYIHGVQT